jgi:glycosyltransferase involved in cell wall biosynthesis
MVLGKIVTVVMPAFNAERTLEQTYNEIPRDIVDYIVLVDDASRDNTVQLARELGINHVIRHEKNKGYGGNQKTCYNKALELNSDIVIMVHPDYQYTPLLIPSLAYLIANEVYDVVLASRILGKGALKGGMPKYKYLANRFLTLFQNIMIGQKLSEYHSGYRAFSGKALRCIKYMENSDDFVFDNQMLSQIFMAGFEIAEITCPTNYFDDASSINFRRSLKYGLGVLSTSLAHFLHKNGIIKNKIYEISS